MRSLLCSLFFIVIACDIDVPPEPERATAVAGDTARLVEAVRALETRTQTAAASHEQDSLTCSPVGAFEGQAVHCTPAPEISGMALAWSLPDEPGAPVGTGASFDFEMPAVCDVGYRFVTVQVEARDADGVLVVSDAIDLVAVNAGP